MKSMNDLNNLLNAELEAFISILQFSEKFLEEVPSLPVHTISKMVEYRQEWIEKIQTLEEKRRELLKARDEEEINPYLKEISEVAKKLVAIDEKIYQHLQERKIQYVREHSELVNQKEAQKRLANNRNERSGSVDIIQE